MWKKRLRDFRKMVIEGLQLKQTIEDVKGRLCAPGGQKLSLVQYGHSGDGHGMESQALTHLQLLDEYWHRVNAIEREQLAIEQAMVVLSPEQRMVIRLYYFEVLKNWDLVSEKANYSVAQVHRFHSSALRALEEAENE